MPLSPIVWTTAGRSSCDSMPIGNGDIAANVWVEAGSGDLLLLLAKSDAWDAWGRLLKLGRVRIRCLPTSLFGAGNFVAQTLDVQEGCIHVEGRCDGNVPAKLTVFVDAHAPVIRISLQAPGHYSLTAVFETWRTESRTLSDEEMGGGNLYGRSSAERVHDTLRGLSEG